MAGFLWQDESPERAGAGCDEMWCRVQGCAPGWRERPARWCQPPGLLAVAGLVASGYGCKGIAEDEMNWLSVAGKRSEVVWRDTVRQPVLPSPHRIFDSTRGLRR